MQINPANNYKLLLKWNRNKSIYILDWGAVRVTFYGVDKKNANNMLPVLVFVWWKRDFSNDASLLYVWDPNLAISQQMS